MQVVEAGTSRAQDDDPRGHSTQRDHLRCASPRRRRADGPHTHLRARARTLACVLATIAALIAPPFELAAADDVGRAGGAGSDGDVGEVRVESLRFEGVQAVAKSELRDHMLTRSRSVLRFWNSRPTWSEGVFAEDLERIEQLYRDHGYYDAVVEADVVERHEGQRVAITVRVEEGEPVRLAALDLTLGSGAPIEAEALAAALPIQPGDVFAIALYQGARTAALTRLADAGHPDASLEGGAEVDVASRTARITWHFEPGPRVVFGEVRVEGLDRIDESIVAREIEVVPGETYSPRALRRTRDGLLRSRLFRYVSVQPESRAARVAASAAAATPEPSAQATTGAERAEAANAASEASEAKGAEATGAAEATERAEPTTGAEAAEPTAPADAADAAEPTGATEGEADGDEAESAPGDARAPVVETWPIVVQLDERPPRSIGLGVGWSSGQGIRGSAGWSHRNFLGGARRLDAASSGSKLEQRASLGLTQPYLFGRREASLVVDTLWRRRSRNSYDSNTAEIEIGPRWSLGPHWLVESSYRFGWSDVNNITDDSNEVLRAQRDAGLLSGFGVRVRRADLDRATNPHRGTWMQAGVHANLKVLGSDFDWMRYDAEARGYLPLGHTVFAARARFGVIDPLGSTTADEVPLGARLFLGGPHTGRGFPFEELGPLDASGEPVGGVTSLLMSAEWRVPVWGPVTAIGFVDVGQINLEAFEIDADQFGIGSGAGLAFNTPIGPVATHLAWPIRPVEVSQKLRFAITIGHSF